VYCVILLGFSFLFGDEINKFYLCTLNFAQKTRKNHDFIWNIFIW